MLGGRPNAWQPLLVGDALPERVIGQRPAAVGQGDELTAAINWVRPPLNEPGPFEAVNALVMTPGGIMSVSLSDVGVSMKGDDERRRVARTSNVPGYNPCWAMSGFM